MNNYIITGFLLGAILITIYFLIIKSKHRQDNYRKFQQPVIILSDNELVEKVKILLASQKKIDAIKLVKSQRKLNLLEAKDFVESLE